MSRWTGPAGTVLLIGVALCGPLRGARAANGEVTTLAIEEDGLQARIVADAPMFYAVTNDPKQAPFIGFARAGTPVSEYKVLEGGAYVVVGMPFLRPDREGTVREGFQDQHSEDYLHVFLPAQVGKTTMAMAKGESSAAADQYGLFREISVQPGQPGFAFVQCGKTRILERRGPHMRVAAEFDAGELHGWIDAAPPGARDRICDTRALRVRGWMRYIPDLPHGYDRVSDAITAPKLLSLAKSKGALFRPEKSAGGLACKGWRFSPSDNPRRGKLMLDKEDLPADYKEISSRYAIGGSVLSLLHPVSCRKDGTMITAGCFGAFSLVRFYSDRAIVVRGSIAATGYGVPKVVGFRTSTTQTWYFHRNDCERALATESTRPVDCCWEIPSAGK